MNTTTQTHEETTRAEKTARICLNEITEIIHSASEHKYDEIYEYPLSVETRSGWTIIAGEELKSYEYRIVLCTGGPHIQIVGKLEKGQPVNAKLQFQDWGTQCENLLTDDDEDKILLEFAQNFYFGE